MTKIIIISCIIAAICVFQTAEARLLNLPISSQRQNGMSDMGNVSGMPDIIKKVQELINNIRNAVMVAVNNLMGAVKSIKATVNASLNQLQTSEVCKKAHNGVTESVNTLVSNVKACMQEGKQSLSEPIQKLMVPLRNLIQIVLKAVMKIYPCIQMPTIQCTLNLPQVITELSSKAFPLIDEIMKYAPEFKSLFHDVGQCYATALESVGKNDTVINDVKECVTSVLTPLKL